MNHNFHYIVVTIINKQYFVNKDNDFVHSFDDIKEFYSFDEAKQYIEDSQLNKINARVIEYIESTV